MECIENYDSRLGLHLKKIKCECYSRNNDILERFQQDHQVIVRKNDFQVLGSLVGSTEYVSSEFSKLIYDIVEVINKIDGQTMWVIFTKK